MRDINLFYLMVAAMLAVLVILASGIATFAKGGEFNRKYGNKLMRLRLIAQAIAIALFLLYMAVPG